MKMEQKAKLCMIADSLLVNATVPESMNEITILIDIKCLAE